MSERRKTSARRQHARVTISDVAREAGVSPMTVSRVINAEVAVRDATREKVEKAIAELGYSPNKAARSLASARQMQIGLLYANPSSTYLSAMLLGVLERARQSDAQVVVVESGFGKDAVAAVRGMLMSGVDGVLLTPPLTGYRPVLEILHDSGVQTVTLGAQHVESEISTVSIDDHRAAMEMTRHLLDLGHERIGFIVGNNNQLASRLRLAGFREAMRLAGVDVDESLVVRGDFSYRSGLKAADLLLRLEQRPTAIFASNDDMAAAVVATAHRFHIEVPEALTVVGYDDTLLATTIWPELTTIRQPIADMSRAAIELLETNIRIDRAGEPVKARHLTRAYKLVRRESSAPPR
ncbi:LacI family transcriptional regulator [Marinihelvus fidelis]|uniref:LacI family transcriptional regulator n=1 Tax=Marinihelvus fidelis TaxID=2613842 RepID=A0A5N0TD01_9GAMM|nr:LacI family DNA-binding transcriptional regulator [Marinihelvus fidelis]KAA9132631.1 LacI family transcriptional regulator [Marinihelvus fidelis]